MQYFVRFTHGDNAAIGFHDIPTKNGRPLQTDGAARHAAVATAASGRRCPTPSALWDFAPVGTKVVVTA